MKKAGIAQTNFEELEGKEVKVVFPNGENYTCTVAGCEYDIGITFVNKDNKKHEVYCLNKRQQEERKAKSIAYYDKEFYWAVETIKKGIHIAVENPRLVGLALSVEFNGNATCAFK